MRIHLSEEEKKRLIHDERERRKIVRQHQVRVQSDAFVRKQTTEMQKKKHALENRVRTGLEKAISNKMENLVESIRRSSGRRASLSSVSSKSTTISKTKSNGDDRSISSRLRRRPLTRIDAVVADLRGKEAQIKMMNEKNSQREQRDKNLQRKQSAKEQANLVMRHGALDVPNSR
ncbi:unnamed protein product [Auanema sp. JU1783]|nr:unnamed protein product [Auanema sp. JU1783]